MGVPVPWREAKGSALPKADSCVPCEQTTDIVVWNHIAESNHGQTVFLGDEDAINIEWEGGCDDMESGEFAYVIEFQTA